MKVTRLIMSLIVAFAILAGVNVFFSTLASRASSAMSQAYILRNEIRDAIFGMRIGFVNLTRLARSYVMRVEPGDTLLYDEELDLFWTAHRNFLATNPLEAEVYLLERAMEFQVIIRERDALAFETVAAGDPEMALDIIHDPHVVQYWVDFIRFFDELDLATTIRTQELVNRATRSATFFGTLANAATLLFAVFSVSGTMLALSHTKTAMRREREAHELTQTLLNSAPLVIDLWDDSRKLVSTSRQSMEMFGLSSQEQYLEMFDKLSPERQPCGMLSREKTLEYLEEGFREGYSRFEWMRQTLDGKPMPTKITLVRFRTNGSNMLVSYTSDMREEKRRELAEEESRAKTRFLARMSHEIRTPMNAVLGITEIQLQNTVHPPETEEAFLRIYSSSNLLLTIINDILDLSKIEADKMEIVPAVYDMASLIVDTTQLNLMHIGSKRIEFKLEVAERLPAYVMGDELRLKQILNNLLSNAFKYTSSGQVVLAFDLEQSERPEETTLVIRVQDTGQGMTQEQLDHLFEIEFTRFNLKSNRAIEGSGLGMMISYQLINMMRGNITVESEPGKGSTFTVRIPQKPHGNEVFDRETVDNLQNLEVTQKSLRRITRFTREPMPYGRALVVDDVESNLYVVKSFLMPYRIAVQTVTSGYDAVEKIQTGEEYDIIFMDHMMPGMDGIEATKIMRTLGYKHPIVALTANTFKGATEMFMNNGFSGFISKPLDLNLLNSYLIRFIRDKQPPDVIARARNQKTDAENVNGYTGLSESFLLDAGKALDVFESTTQILESSKDALKDLTTQAHSMKSAFANLGRNELSMYAAAVEIAGRKNDIKTLKAFSPRLIDILREIIDELSPEDAEQDADDEDLPFLQATLDTISEACEQYDIDTAKELLDQLNQRQYSRKHKKLFKDIATHLLYGDFEEAAVMAIQFASRITID